MLGNLTIQSLALSTAAQGAVWSTWSRVSSSNISTNPAGVGSTESRRSSSFFCGHTQVSRLVLFMHRRQRGFVLSHFLRLRLPAGAVSERRSAQNLLDYGTLRTRQASVVRARQAWRGCRVHQAIRTQSKTSKHAVDGVLVSNMRDAFLRGSRDLALEGLALCRPCARLAGVGRLNNQGHYASSLR